MSIASNLSRIKSELPEGVILIAVSKTKPVRLIKEAYDAGQRDFGENKVQELIDKQVQLPDDIHWHLIGHLQTNKVKYVAPFVSMIHSVDSLKLLVEINKQALKNSRTIDCLLQFHIAEEETKFGLSIEEAIDLLSDNNFLQLKNIRICGIMGMATFTDDEAQIRKEFAYLTTIFGQLKSKFFSGSNYFNQRSMGMSSDYKIAIDEGSTMIRVGSNLFGER